MQRLLFHVVVVVHHLFCALYSQTVDFSDATHSYVIDAGYYPWRFATIWNFALQTVFFALCAAEDLMLLNGSKTWQNFQERTRKVLSSMFAMLIFPAGMSVFFVFWVMFTYDRELVYPTEIDAKLPSWYNHSLHTVVALVVLVEIFVSRDSYPRRKTAMIYVNAYVTTYALVSLVTYWVMGSWVYPLLDQLTWSQRGIFLLSYHLLHTVMYHLGELLNYQVWGGAKRRDRPASKQRKVT